MFRWSAPWAGIDQAPCPNCLVVQEAAEWSLTTKGCIWSNTPSPTTSVSLPAGFRNHDHDYHCTCLFDRRQLNQARKEKNVVTELFDFIEAISLILNITGFRNGLLAQPKSRLFLFEFLQFFLTKTSSHFCWLNQNCVQIPQVFGSLRPEICWEPMMIECFGPIQWGHGWADATRQQQNGCWANRGPSEQRSKPLADIPLCWLVHTDPYIVLTYYNPQKCAG